jgi:hypothetical protein
MTHPVEENNPKGQERIKHWTHRIKNTFGVDMKLYDTSNEKNIRNGQGKKNNLEHI